MQKRISGRVVLCLLASSLVAQQAVQTRTNAKDGQPYVSIPAGRFMMGCSSTDQTCAPDESPAHAVEITHAFWMGQTPVTVGAWKRYRAASGKSALPAVDDLGRKINEATGDDNQPVVEATWDDAKGYCSWAGMRLPTEAEWEYAARAGTTDATYGWLDSIAWYADNSGKKPMDSVEVFHLDPSRYQKHLLSNGNGPHAVKGKTPNAWGLYDALGNVWQWVEDYYANDYYASSDKQNPTGPRSGTQRVLRGAAWNSVPANVRVSYRLTNPPGDRVDTFGFRCAGDLP